MLTHAGCHRQMLGILLAAVTCAGARLSVAPVLASDSPVRSEPSGEETFAPWPPITPSARPWTYWWWMASAVDRSNLTRELTRRVLKPDTSNTSAPNGSRCCATRSPKPAGWVLAST